LSVISNSLVFLSFTRTAPSFRFPSLQTTKLVVRPKDVWQQLIFTYYFLMFISSIQLFSSIDRHFKFILF
jgi:hypothetical protein